MTQVATEASAVEEAPARDAPPGYGPPAWLRFIALAAAGGVLTFGSVGLFLAVNGWYKPALAFPIGAVAWVALLALAAPAFAPRAPVRRDAHVYAAVGIALILGITAWNAAHASQHVLLNRDGGSYANTGRWIARDGSLDVKPRVSPLAADPTLKFASPAVYQMPDGTLQFQFAHMLPAVLAEAYAIGGDTGLFHAPEVLGGIALLAFFVLAWRLFRRPLFALAAMLALAFIIPQVSFSRDSYSEIPSQILLFTALWLLVSPRPFAKWRVALAAGLFLGALEAIRIDAIVFLIGVPVVLAIAWLRAAATEQRRAVLVGIGAFVGGLVPGLLLGFVDLTRHSGNYYSDLSHDVKQLVLAVAASAIASAIVVAAWPRLSTVLARLPRPTIANVAAVHVGLGGVVAWLIRPRIQHMHGVTTPLVGGLQTLEHVAVDPTRNYFERSMVWMAWYLGPLTVAVAILGAALLVRELLLGRRMRVIAVVAVLAPGSVLYLYKASAVSDHVWVTRRFLVSAFPLLVLLALGLAAALSTRPPSPRLSIAWRVAAVLFAISAVAYPLHTMWRVRSMTEQRGYLAVVHEVCGDIGDHAGVVVLSRTADDALGNNIPQTLRSFCGADVGVERATANADTLRNLARSFAAQGRRLFVVAGAPDVVTNLFPNTPVVTTREAVNTHLLLSTLTHRPDAYARQAFSVVLAQVPTA